MAPVIPSTFSLYTSSSPSFFPRNPFKSSISLSPDTFIHINSPWLCNASKKPSFVDQILDYIEGGPKLRKWYGAPDLLPKDGSTAEEENDSGWGLGTLRHFHGSINGKIMPGLIFYEPLSLTVLLATCTPKTEIEEVRDAVLITDGDTEIGQMVILSLIVKRARVKALVKDRRAALEAYGNYVEPLAGDVNDKGFLKKALKGVRAIICPTEGFLSKVGNLQGVQHVVLLSQLSVYKGADGIQALMTGNARKLAEQDESMVIASGIPYTIIRAGYLQNTPGGTQGFSFQEGSAAKGSLSKEDAAFVCVEALGLVPETGFTVEVVNGEEKVSDWKQKFTELMAVDGKGQG